MQRLCIHPVFVSAFTSTTFCCISHGKWSSTCARSVAERVNELVRCAKQGHKLGTDMKDLLYINSMPDFISALLRNGEETSVRCATENLRVGV